VTKSAPTPLTVADYERAVELSPAELMSRLRNVHVVPYWIGSEDRFWFRNEEQNGHRFVVVDAATGAAAAAFDHELVAQALDADANALPIEHFSFVDGDQAIIAKTGGRSVRIDLVGGAVSPLEPLGVEYLAGPGGEAVFKKDFNLWLRAADGTERPLTDDGEEFNAWAGSTDADLRKIARNRGVAPPTAPSDCYWSPDGRHILARRTDERGVEPYAYLESVPIDGSVRPKVHFIRQQLAGEDHAPISTWSIIDVASKARVKVDELPGRLELGGLQAESWWTPDGGKIRMLAGTSDADEVALVEIDPRTGAVRIVHRETSSTFYDLNTYLYNLPNVRILPQGDAALWYSQKDGWGHLYVIDLNTGAVRQLTEGKWPVFDVIAVTADTVFFTAGGREPGRDPYYRHLYRVDLDGPGPNSGLKLLTPDDADHGFPGETSLMAALALGRPQGLSQMSPSARYFLDCVSTVDLAPVYQLRDTEGALIAEIARADISALEALGWRPPEMFTAKAADGVTDLYGVLVKPRDFDATRAYPVLERIYGGPQIIARPRTFLDGVNGSFIHGLNALAEFGFVIAVLDGPGTPYRSKAFHDLPYGKADRWGVAHHRAAIEGAAKTRPWMDLSCVGVSGHSFGGYGTAMAMLLEPDFYKVGVSSAGMYDPMWSPRGVVEHYFARPTFADGRHVKSTPAEVPPNVLQISPSHYADRLQGTLMLAFGDLDENIQPAALLNFVNALIAAGKTFDLLQMPGRTHAFAADPYFHKRVWDYFIEHVQGRKPLIHYRPEMRQGVRLFI
jgi:dipeptidyl aminopeptidase/acylaminoacyl peptidase